MTASAITGKVVLAVLWLIAIWRIPTRRSSARDRTAFVAFVGFPLAYTINQPEVTRFVDTISGVPDLAVLAKHLVGMAAAGAALEALDAVAVRPDERGDAADRHRYWGQRLLIVATMVAMTLLFATIPRDAGGEDFVTDRSTMPAVTAYGLLYQVTLGALVVAATGLFGRHWRRAPTRSARGGLLLIACGTAVGVCYVVNRVTFIVTHFAGVHTLRGPSYVVTSRTLLAASLLLITTGSLVATSGRYLREFRYYLALSRLRGLWSALCAEAPGVVLGDPPSRWSDLLAVRGLRLRLYRRVIEIRDAQLTLLARLDPAHLAHADDLASRVAPGGAADPVLVEACRLEYARQSNRQSNRQLARQSTTVLAPAGSTPARPEHPSSGELDLDAEVMALLRLRATLSSPEVRTACARRSSDRPELVQLAGERGDTTELRRLADDHE